MPLGIVRKLDSLGRLVIPKEVRNILGFDDKDSIEFFVREEKIYIKRYNLSCVFCGSTEETMDYKGKNVCKKCINNL